MKAFTKDTVAVIEDWEEVGNVKLHRVDGPFEVHLGLVELNFLIE